MLVKTCRLHDGGFLGYCPLGVGGLLFFSARVESKWQSLVASTSRAHDGTVEVFLEGDNIWITALSYTGTFNAARERSCCRVLRCRRAQRHALAPFDSYFFSYRHLNSIAHYDVYYFVTV